MTYPGPKSPGRLETALRSWWQLVADEAAGILAPSGVVQARKAEVMKRWDAMRDGDAAHQVYLDAIERWLGEGKGCPICGTATLCEISMTDPGESLYITLTWDPTPTEETADAIDV